MKIIVPMAGKGSRFTQQGYTTPKPFLDVNGKAMVIRATEMFAQFGELVFLVREEHRELAQDLPGDIVVVPEVTEGAACTVLLAEAYMWGEEILIVNSDQIIEYSPLQFSVLRQQTEVNGIVFVFSCPQGNTKWSYARLENSRVVEVAEKRAISEWATSGAYYWRRGGDFIRSARQMIEKNVRVNNEFYVCPVYNEFVGENVVVPLEVSAVHQLGTPEEYEVYVSNST